MKVKISYTVDLDKVPGEIDFLLEKAERDLGKAFDLVTQLKEIKETSIEEALKTIPEIREAMMTADIVFDDCELILTGYLSTKYGPPDIPVTVSPTKEKE